MNKSHDYRALEREYITSQISLRELCRRHGITAHSLVTVQARKRQWAEKRAAHQARSSEAFIEKHADRLADRQAQIRDKALDAIDEAITRFRQDLRTTEKKRIDGEWFEVPVMRLTPKDLAIFIDRFQVLFDMPSVISQRQGFTVTSELSTDVLRDFFDATRGIGRPSPMERSHRCHAHDGLTTDHATSDDRLTTLLPSPSSTVTDIWEVSARDLSPRPNPPV